MPEIKQKKKEFFNLQNRHEPFKRFGIFRISSLKLPKHIFLIMSIAFSGVLSNFRFLLDSSLALYRKKKSYYLLVHMYD